MSLQKFAPHTLFAFQLVAHLALVYGVITFSLNEWLVVLFIYFLTGCIGVSMTYHRLLSHGAYKSPKWLERFGTLCATYGLIGSSLAWVNNHRAHHYHADRAGDPHSPLLFGFIKVQWFSMFYSKSYFRFVKKLIKDPFHTFMHRHYFTIHASILLILLLTLGWHFAALLYLAPAAVLWNAGSLINTLCHNKRLGYVNFQVKDNSRNNPILGLLVWGEGWHNNHHKFPARASFTQKWWELDISYLLISAINRLSNAGIRAKQF